MVGRNAQGQAFRTRRNQENNYSQPDRDKCAGIGREGETPGDKQVAANRTNWEGQNLLGNARGAISGGIVERLIAQTRNQVEESEAHTAKLKQQLQELEELLEELTQSSNESE
ncbi:hypothetical protein NIES4074_48590 [Cylindrospermum sp. NIES-4074]|nr:hypothetical protein NIES4074_48590 [Cylindrospermum sp. NIES-4074]